MKLFPTEGGLVTLWAARSLLFLRLRFQLFGMGWLVSLSASQIAAAMMAVSPYGIYLAQEARHYTLAILLIIFPVLPGGTRAIHRRISSYGWD